MQCDDEIFSGLASERRGLPLQLDDPAIDDWAIDRARNRAAASVQSDSGCRRWPVGLDQTSTGPNGLPRAAALSGLDQH